MEDEDDSIDSSPTPVRAHSSMRVRHWRKGETSLMLDNVSTNSVSATGTQLECDKETLQLNDQVSWFEADRLDCQRAQQEPKRAPPVPASENFMSLQFMLESQQLPLEEAELDLSPQHEAEENPETPERLQSIQNSIVLEILKDFCSSPSYEKDEPPVYYVSPQFRFYNKKLRTYQRRCRVQPTTHLTTDDDDERMSCSSGLSVQEDFITEMPTRNHCEFDANSSQRICENLLNLSAFFTQNNANSSIDLPADRAQTEAMLVEDPQDASDILKDNGYFIGNTEQCKLLDDCNDTKVNKELTLFGGSNRLPTMETHCKTNNRKDGNLFDDCLDWFADDINAEAFSKKADLADAKPAKEAVESKETNDSEFFDGIPFSEWQPMDLPKPASNVPKEIPTLTEKQQLESNVCNQLEEIPLSEWQPMDIPDTVQFRTASNKTIEISEEQQKEPLKLMADLEASYPQQAKGNSTEFIVPNAPDKIEFRTASNKTVKLTEEMQKRAAMLMADLEAINGGNQLEKESEFHTASNRNMTDIEINITKREEEFLDEIPFSEWQPMEISPKAETNDCSSQLDVIPLSEWQPMDIAESVEFRTASNKIIDVSEEKQKEAAKLMADVETIYSQTLREASDKGKQPEEVLFRTASNKTLELTDEMRKKAAMLMTDLETVQESTNECHPSNSTSETRGFNSTHPKDFQFRTASNKTLELTDEMRKKAAMLMADLETVQESTNECHPSNSTSETREFNSTHPKDFQFRTASNKTLELTDEMRKKAAMLMADLETVQESTNECHPSNSTIEIRGFNSTHPKDFQFRTASNKPLELTEEMRKKAAMLLADLDTIEAPANAENQSKSISETVACVRSASKKPIQVSEDMLIATKNLLADVDMENVGKLKECDTRKDCLMTATPQPRKFESISSSVFETPKCTPELQDSLTQLSERSPLDKATKSSIITRRNLLSLNKRRKLKRDSENIDTADTPNRQRFNPMTAATSTPVPNRKENIKADAQCRNRERRCSQETPARVGKRRSEEALSPIYAPTNKTRRLGLSRIRNKSSNDI
ncbi:breast cancer type 2 susceptibility protein homolog isoform X2 [Drosophila innubila]|uniref:breast cancer type 2 susceptibility protein homolog isoform X2 n=1 Tax=Drosophila innubila TaxID=198719 RepID=UPI00148D3998|nr:breast cancer type 2 susceptibility protein homolog isoform X2 [Drosophila innubila]